MYNIGLLKLVLCVPVMLTPIYCNQETTGSLLSSWRLLARRFRRVLRVAPTKSKQIRRTPSSYISFSRENEK